MTVEELAQVVGKGDTSAWVSRSLTEIRSALEYHSPHLLQKFDSLSHIHSMYAGGVSTASQELSRLRVEVERLRSVLEQIAEYDAGGPEGYVDEWMESVAFTACQRIAAEAIAPAPARSEE